MHFDFKWDQIYPMLSAQGVIIDAYASYREMFVRIRCCKIRLAVPVMLWRTATSFFPRSSGDIMGGERNQ